VCLLITQYGDRLLLSSEGSQKIRFVTAWGTRDIPVESMQSLTAQQGDVLGFALVLKEGTRVFGAIKNETITLRSLRFGKIEIPPLKMKALIRAPHPGQEAGERVDPYVVLKAENIIVGKISLPQLHLVVNGEIVPVPSNQVRRMQRITEDEDAADAGLDDSIFELELWGAGRIRGRLQERMLSLKTAQGVWDVPAADIVELESPAPTIPDSLRDKIAGLIRDLGHPDWEKREEATTALKDMGALAKRQLAEVSRQTNDPEVKRRADALLQEIKE
jgi:hypothetical protein